MTKSKNPIASAVATVYDTAALIAAAVPLLKGLEGKGDGNPKTPKLDVYPDSAGWATIGYGHLLTDPETGRRLAWHIKADREAAIRMVPEGITEEEATAILIGDITVRVASLRQHTVFRGLNLNQQLALLSLSFNIGVAALLSSTLVRLIEAGQFDVDGCDFATLYRVAVKKAPITQIDEAFTAWCRETLPSGLRSVNEGLFTRRYAEFLIFQGADAEAACTEAWAELKKFRRARVSS